MIDEKDPNLIRYIQENILVDRPALFYKFRKVNGEGLEQIIKHQTLRFANPFGWNDPWDGHVMVDTTNTRAEITRWARSYTAGLTRPRAREFARKILKDPTGFHQVVNETAREQMEYQGLCCFTSGWEYVLQWAYYADGHKGVALGFDWREDIPLFSMTMKVKYLDVYPRVNYIRDPFACLSNLLLAKSQEWQHENEVRVWHSPPGNKPFQPSALKEITFGARCPVAHMKLVKGWCKEAGLTGVKFFRAFPKPWMYKLDRAPI